MNGCADSRPALGAYVLGALDPADRSRVEAHLAGCADCRDELAALAALPGLLGRVSLPEVEAGAEPVGAPLLNRVLEAAARERRRQSLRRRSLVAAGAVIVAASASVAGVAVTSSGSSGGTAAAATLIATDPATHVTASVTEWTKAWGASLQVRVTGETTAAYDGRCRLLAIRSDGAQDVAASWTATPSGQIVASGATAFSPAEIVAFEIVTERGSVLVAVPASAASST